jgi:DNA polymerase-4
MTRKILHVDMDAFYASIEQRDHPELSGKPVIVGGRPEERGVVAAASYEARKYGIHSAMPTARALKLCPHAVVLKPRMGYYREISRRIREIFCSYTPLVEPISLDEAFLDVTGSERLFGPAEHIGREIKRRIHDELRLTCSVGLAPNKFLAKLASDHEKPDGFTVIRPAGIEGFLRGLPIEKLWGVGPATAERLRELDIRTVRDLQQVPREELLERFGKWGLRLWELARGIDERPGVSEREPKSRSRETTFPEDIRDPVRLQRVLRELAYAVTQDLKEEERRARTVQIKVRFADFTTITRRVTLPEPTGALRVIAAAARLLLEHRVDPADRGRGVRLLGVGVSNLAKQTRREAPLFESLVHGDTDEDLDRIVEELRRRLSRNLRNLQKEVEPHVRTE